MVKIQEVLANQVHVSELFHIYGELLSKRQRMFIEQYYDENLSLSEIAERYQISRQAVHDAIKHGRAALEKFEATLHLMQILRRGGGSQGQAGWRKKADMILDEMEKSLNEDASGLEERLQAQIASLRDILPPPREEGSGSDEAGDGVAA
ncbi:MAG: hypothetical protein IPI28_02435 [Candidatus Omnitrophica bacterium]|nr:hypothetical protein [Candidatus Omnitrophota bacterium]